MIDVEICGQYDDPRVEGAFLGEVARRTLLEEGVAAADVRVALVDDAAIHELNRRHLSHDSPTDVLSFLLECTSAAGRDREGGVPRGSGKQIDGDVVVSLETAARRAECFGWSPQNEAALYVVHGLLHLCGYDDGTAAERAAMRARERELLGLWDLEPHYEERTSSSSREPSS
jgi:probable rRNA maturation factor